MRTVLAATDDRAAPVELLEREEGGNNANPIRDACA